MQKVSELVGDKRHDTCIRREQSTYCGRQLIGGIHAAWRRLGSFDHGGRASHSRGSLNVDVSHASKGTRPGGGYLSVAKSNTIMEKPLLVPAQRAVASNRVPPGRGPVRLAVLEDHE